MLKPDLSWIELFPQKNIHIIIQDILDTLPKLTKPPKSCMRPEEHLTQQLHNKVKQNQRYYTGPLSPSIEHWISDESRTDMLFLCGKGQETYFAVEAKRLFITYPGGKKADLIKEYIDDGMMRFIKGRYAPYQLSSAMLGYVFDVSCSKVREVLGHALVKRTDLSLVGTLEKSLLPVTPPVDETQHALEKGIFTLYHLFVKIEEGK